MIHDPQDTTVFPKLADEEVAWLSGYGEELTLDAGEYLFRENEAVDSFYVLLEGELRVLRPTNGGDEPVATHLPGEFTGQLAVLAGTVPRHRVRAAVASRVLEVTSGVFRKVSAERPEVADVFISALSRRVRENQDWARQNEKLAALGKLSAGGRPKGWSLDRDPYLLETSVPGIFVTGDVRHGSVKRVASGVGEGSIAVQFIHQYLSKV